MRARESGKGRGRTEPMNFAVISHNANVAAADDAAASRRKCAIARARRVRRNMTRNEISCARWHAGYISLVTGIADVIALL
jgi:hypothetical protein